MAQVLPEDFPIDPGATTGGELAGILNRQFEALQSTNSGSQAPQEPTAGMLWLDTSGSPDGVLKIRNGSNTAWNPMSEQAGSTLESLGIPNHDKLLVTDDATARNVNVTSLTGSAYFALDAATGLANSINGYKNHVIHWQVLPGNNTTASDFMINRFSDAGAYVGTPFMIERATGVVRTRGNLLANAGGPAGLAGQMGFDFNLPGNEYSVYFYSTPAYRLGMNAGNGTTFLMTNGVSRTQWGIDGALVHNSGSALKPGGGVWGDSSDERIKENITDYTHGLAEVLQLRPRTYTFKPETERDASITYTGLIAQECEGALPEMVTAKPGKAGTLEFEDMRTLDTSALTYALVNAVKTLAARLDALEGAAGA